MHYICNDSSSRIMFTVDHVALNYQYSNEIRIDAPCGLTM